MVSAAVKAGSKFGKGFGKMGAKRVKRPIGKGVRVKTEGLGRADYLRICRKAGAKRVSKGCYVELAKIAVDVLEKVMKTARHVAQNNRKSTINAVHVRFALKVQGVVVYGY